MKAITSWPMFAKFIRANQNNLLNNFPGDMGLVFVSGCQRSGTTLLTNLFLDAPGFIDYRSGGDSELEGALILAGHNKLLNTDGRYCFQTTYLNERYFEYFNNQGKFKLIFIVRNPYSVVYSMVYNWKQRSQLFNFALNELFLSCADKGHLSPLESHFLRMFGPSSLSSIKKACLSYNGKISQVIELHNHLRDHDLLVIEYDDIITKSEKSLAHICTFCDIPPNTLNTSSIHSIGLTRANKLSINERNTIKDICWDTYIAAKELAIKLD